MRTWGLILAVSIAAVILVTIIEAHGATVIESNQPAPYGGVLLTEREFNALADDVRTAEKQASNYSALSHVLTLRVSSMSNQIYILETINANQSDYIANLNEIYALEKRQWYDSPPLWFVAGVLTGGALLYGGAWVAGTVK